MISKHISDREGVYSRTAMRKEIDNIPNEDELKNMKLLAKEVFEPLRRWVDGPIKINSFFRSEELNKAIGGAKSSQHCKGQAVDIDDTFGNATNAQMYSFIKENLNFDQMIWEFGDSDNPDWIHVSYVCCKTNRNRCLLAYKKNGKSKYKVI